jgi:electron transfer flavoprotein alpha subunit
MNPAGDTQTIVVIAEHFDGAIRPTTYESISFAKALQQLRPGTIKIIVLGEDVDSLARELAHTSGENVLGINASELSQYNGQIYAAVLYDVFNQEPPAYICAAHSSQGWDFGPGLAARLKATCITAVNQVSARDETIYFTRDIYGGKVSADIISKTKTTLITVQPGCFRWNQKSNQEPGVVNIISPTIDPQASNTLSTHAHQASDLDLSQAKVIVSAGRGIGEEDNLDLIHQLATAIPQAVVCGSRPVIDNGWLSYERQVGVTGATVSPDLYLACGISGAAQHVSGMQGSALVVSINTDPMAAIFNQSDICVVEDLTVFIPILLEKLSEATRAK